MKNELAWLLLITFSGFFGAACGTGNVSTGVATTNGTAGAPPSASGAAAGGGFNLDLAGNAGSAVAGAGGATTTNLPTCDPSCSAVGTCENAVCTVTENVGSVPPELQTSLQGVGTSDAEFRWLYPYDKTVFARGLTSPTLQLAGGGADAWYVHVAFAGFDYKGFYGASDGPSLKLSAPVWTALTSAAKATDVVKVEVSKIRAGVVVGPITESWTVAQGSLRGTIYYEVVGSRLLEDAQNGGVGIMRMKPGDSAPQILKAGCANACHTASADGSTLVAAGSGIASFTDSSSTSYDLKNDASTIKNVPDSRFVFGGLYPDGSLTMSATHHRLWDRARPSRLYDTKSGDQVPAAGWDDRVTNAGVPAFSPDGAQIVFNQNEGRAIAKMDFARATNTFSNQLELVGDSNAGASIPGGSYLGWPTFTPDGRSVVFHAGSSELFEAAPPNTGDLYRVDVDTRQVARLDALNGNPYLPQDDLNLNFVPTVLPVAVGGYYWIMFTSHRAYGNVLDSATAHGNGKLWIAALDATTGAADSSHPAFYLEGQELEANNLRGFWVLDPCKQDGNNCESGDQCCGGFCREIAGTKQCGTPPPGGETCSNELEKCTKASDCCDHKARCINSHCAQVIVPK